ncbi:MAG TPA: acyltransferase [Pyrinomonadaceae bacterium]|nr:acyltransferase [Pyrinomonadaceae bacterium]
MQFPTTFFSSRSDRDSNQVFYHPELDVLRFFAFLAVFIHHALPRDASLYLRNGLSPFGTNLVLAAKDAGAYGVDLFFALSAYLITELLLREHAKFGTFSVSAFYVRRALRIWPLYFAFLALTVFVVPSIFSDERFGPMYIVSFALFFGNWVCAAYGLPFSVASPLWSISVEEQFYIAWPLLLLLFGVNRIKQLAIVLLAIALGTRILLAAYGAEHPAVWANTFARLDPIALGAVLAVVLGGRAPRIKGAFRVLMIGGALASFLLVAKYLEQDGPTSIATYSVTALASVVLLIAVLQRDARLLRFPPFTWLVYLGRISYGLYVFHLLAIALVGQVMFIPLLGIQVNFELRLLMSLLLTILFASVSYTLLEQPFLKFKERFSVNRIEAEREERVPLKSRLLEFLYNDFNGLRRPRRGRLPL